MQLAESLGLSWNGDQELIGYHEGVLVRLDFGEGWMAAQVPSPGFPERLATDTLPRGLLGHSTLHQGFVELRPCVADRLDELVGTARRLAAWWRAPVTALADDHGLGRTAELDRLWGTVDGVRVELAEAVDRSRRVRASVTARIPEALPADTDLRAPGPDAPPTELPDPILGGRISVAGLDGRRLCTDAIRGPLLAVLLDHGGRVTHDRVVAPVRALRDVDGTRRALRDAVDLVRALRPLAHG